MISRPSFTIISVASDLDVALARKRAEAFAREADFPLHRVQDIVLAVSEMAQNLVTHETISGRVLLYSQALSGLKVMNAAALDDGPGIGSPLDAMTDGVSSSNGFGSGLGTIRRLSDRFDMCSGLFGQRPCIDIGRVLSSDAGGWQAGSALHGTVVTASFLSPDSFLDPAGVEAFFYVRPALGEDLSGDGVHLARQDGVARLVLMDALGHGEKAAHVLAHASILLDRIGAEVEPAEVLLAIGHEMGSKGGLAMHVVKIDHDNRRVTAAATGNIYHSLLVDGKARSVPSGSGVVGPVVSKNNIIQTEISDFSWVLGILHTDGLAHMTFRERDGIGSMPSPAILAALIMGRAEEGDGILNPEDDSTVMVWGCKAG